MYAGAEIEFDVRVPVDDDGLRANVAANLARGLPEVPAYTPTSDLITIVANGPTARQCALAGATLALNGSIRLFNERGVAPTYWAGCDPQQHMADFLTDPPKSTTYLVASKCHPDVFEALRDRRVLVWHVDDFATWDLVKDRAPVSTGVSITIVAFELMSRFGFGRFETWGWDGSYGPSGNSHAVPQPHGGQDITVEVGRASFATTTTWALEAQDARQKFLQTPRNVKVKGGGMIGAVLQHCDVAGHSFL